MSTMINTNVDIEEYQRQLIELSLDVGALKFGQFQLKSGRISPYFYLASELNTGKSIDILATAYAKHISSALTDRCIPSFDVIFGPAYKGIPFAASVALVLYRDYGIDVGWAYDRKEVKSHGEGGSLVGASMKDKGVLILDDVLTAGSAIRIAVENIHNAGGKVIGVITCLDREEVTSGENAELGVCAVDQIAQEIRGPVRSLLKMSDLMLWLASQGKEEELEKMKIYQDHYGVKKK